MAGSTLKIVSPADPNWPLGPFTTYTQDLNVLRTTPSAAGFGLLGDPDFGAIQTEATWAVNPGVPGAVQTERHHPVTTMNLRLTARNHANTDAIIGDLHTLAQALDPQSQGMYPGGPMGIMEWQPEGASEVRYIDFYPSPLPTFFRGQQAGMFKILRLLRDSDGLPLVVWRHPYLRGPILNASVNVLNNSTLLEDGNNDGHPDRWFWDSLTGISAEVITWTPSVKAYQFALATGNTRKLRQGTVNPLDTPYGVSHAAAPSDVWSGSFYASATGAAVATCIVEFVKSDGTILATATGTGVNLTTSAQRATVTTSAAPANTAFVRLTLQIANTTGSTVTVTMGDGTGRGAQLEKAAAPSTFRCGQETVRNDTYTEREPLTAPTLAQGAAGNVNVGQHFYRVTFVTADGETVTGPSSNTTIVTSAKQVSLTNIPTGSGRVASRKVWRTKANQADSNANYFLLTTINDNTTTSYTDNTADASLPGGNPNTTGITNAPDQGHAWVWNPGNVNALVQARVTPEASAQVIAMLLAARSTRDGNNLAEFANPRAFEVTSLARMSLAASSAFPLVLDTDTTIVAATEASAGRALQTAPGTTALVRRFQISVTPTDKLSLPGTFQVYGILRSPAVTGPTLVQLTLGIASTGESPLPYRGDVVSLDGTNLASTAFAPVLLGTFTIPRKSPIVVFEGWASVPSAQTLQWDSLVLIPADESIAMLASPGFRSPGVAQEIWLGARSNATATDFVDASVITANLPTTMKGGQLILSVGGATPDAAGTPPSGGTVLPQGRHIFTAHGSLYDTSQAAGKLGELRIYDVTAGGAALATIPLTAKANQTWTTFGDSSATVVAMVVTDVPAANTHAYQAVVVFTHATPTGMKIYLSDITHEFVPAFASTEMALDGDMQQAASLLVGTMQDPLTAPWGFLELGPGVNLVVADAWDLPPVGFDALDARAELGRHIASRNVSLAVNVIPRYAPI